MKDWTGTKQFIASCNNRKLDAEQNDYYATEPRAVEILLQNETFNHYIWECACGTGHISRVLSAAGYDVKSSDIVDRGYPKTEIVDFLQFNVEDSTYIHNRDIITNPPYKYAKEFVEKAMEVSDESAKIAMFLKLTFLEGKARRKMFDKYPPKVVYVFSSRVCCGKNGEFKPSENAVAYAWFVWQKGYTGDTIIKWVN